MSLSRCRACVDGGLRHGDHCEFADYKPGVPLVDVASPPVYDLRVPERGFRSTLACPKRLFVAWHKDCLGVCELLDQDARGVYGKPQERLWDVREYRRVECWGMGARYEHLRQNGRSGGRRTRGWPLPDDPTISLHEQSHRAMRAALEAVEGDIIEAFGASGMPLSRAIDERTRAQLPDVDTIR